METGAFRCDGWASGPVLIARTFRERMKGLIPATAGHGMLIRGRSVHGLGMREPLLAIGLDRERRVVGVRTLLPRHVVLIRSARHIMELPIGTLPPPRGVVLTWEGGGSVGHLCNTHRKPE